MTFDGVSVAIQASHNKALILLLLSAWCYRQAVLRLPGNKECVAYLAQHFNGIQ